MYTWITSCLSASLLFQGAQTIFYFFFRFLFCDDKEELQHTCWRRNTMDEEPTWVAFGHVYTKYVYQFEEITCQCVRHYQNAPFSYGYTCMFMWAFCSLDVDFRKVMTVSRPQSQCVETQYMLLIWCSLRYVTCEC